MARRRSKAIPLIRRKGESEGHVLARAAKVRKAAFAKMGAAGKLCPKKGEHRVCGR